MCKLLFRKVDGEEIPRRFLIFDEKFRMSDIASLSKTDLNGFSNDLEKFASTNNLPDGKTAMLQCSLGSGVIRQFDQLRQELRAENPNGTKVDYPYGFCSLQEDQDASPSAPSSQELDSGLERDFCRARQRTQAG